MEYMEYRVFQDEFDGRNQHIRIRFKETANLIDAVAFITDSIIKARLSVNGATWSGYYDGVNYYLNVKVCLI